MRPGIRVTSGNVQAVGGPMPMMALGKAADHSLHLPQGASEVINRVNISFRTLAVIFSAVMLSLLVPLPHFGRGTQATLNLLHAPAFALLAFVVFAGFRSRTSLPGIVLAFFTWIAMAVVGLMTEVAQSWFHRQPSWDDLQANCLGAAAGLLWVAGLHQATFFWRRWSCRILSLVFVLAAGWLPILIVIDTYRQRVQMPTLASFEDAWEVSRWTHRECRIQRVQQHAVKGRWALRIDLSIGEYPGAALRWPVPDWSEYQELAFDIHLDGIKEMVLVAKVQDIHHNSEPSDRFNRAVTILPGPQTVRISLEEIATAPKTRQLDLRQVTFLQFFVVRPAEERTLYIDHIRLE